MWSGSRQSLDCRERFLVCFFFLGFFRVLGTSALLDLTAKILQGLEQLPEENWEQRSHPGGAQGQPGMSLWISANTWRGAKAAQGSVGFSRAESSRGRSCSSHPFPQIPALEGPSCSSNIPLFPPGIPGRALLSSSSSTKQDLLPGTLPKEPQEFPDPGKGSQALPKGVFPGAGKEEFPGSSPSTEHIFVQRGVYSGQKPIK